MRLLLIATYQLIGAPFLACYVLGMRWSCLLWQGLQCNLFWFLHILQLLARRDEEPRFVQVDAAESNVPPTTTRHAVIHLLDPKKFPICIGFLFLLFMLFFYFSFFKIGYCLVDVWIFGNKMNCGMKYFDYLKAIYIYHIDLEWWFYWMVEAINDYASWCSQHLHPNSWTYWLLTYHAHCHCTVCSGANKYRYLNVSLVNRNHFGFVRMQKSSLAFLYWCCYLLTEITWGVHLLINGITGCLITWRTLTLAVQKCGSSLVSELNRVTWVFLKTHGFYEISPELCNASAPICGSFFF